MIGLLFVFLIEFFNAKNSRLSSFMSEIFHIWPVPLNNETINGNGGLARFFV